MAGNGARSAGLSSAAKLQIPPQIAHRDQLEVWLSLNVRWNAKVITNADRDVSQGSQGITTTGGEMAPAHAATSPVVSPKCSLPNSRTTMAVAEEKSTLRRTATQTEVAVCTPNTR